MAIIRLEKHENPYVILDKAGLEDSRLSWKAKGLLAYLLSRPSDWQVHIRELVTHATDGEEATRTGLQELQRFGYADFRRWHDAQGKLNAEWVIYELPRGDFPHVVSPDVEKPDGENRQATKDRPTKDRVTKERGSEGARPRVDPMIPLHQQAAVDPRPAAIRILAEVTRMTPAPHGTPWKTVCAAVPEGDPQALDRWRQAVTAWMNAGNSTRNIQGMLDWYASGRRDNRQRAPEPAEKSGAEQLEARRRAIEAWNLAHGGGKRERGQDSADRANAVCRGTGPEQAAGP